MEAFWAIFHSSPEDKESAIQQNWSRKTEQTQLIPIWCSNIWIYIKLLILKETWKVPHTLLQLLANVYQDLLGLQTQVFPGCLTSLSKYQNLEEWGYHHPTWISHVNLMVSLVMHSPFSFLAVTKRNKFHSWFQVSLGNWWAHIYNLYFNTWIPWNRIKIKSC